MNDFELACENKELLKFIDRTVQLNIACSNCGNEANCFDINSNDACLLFYVSGWRKVFADNKVLCPECVKASSH